MVDKVIDALLPDKIPIQIKGKKYLLGKLTIAQIIRLTKELVGIIVKMSEQDKSALMKGNTNFDDILAFFGFINEEQLARVLGIVLREEDYTLLVGIELEELSEMVLAFVKKNDIGKIWGNVQQVAKIVISQMKKTSLLPASK